MSTISDQKKRTLEAIQQRYAASKAKKVQDEKPKFQKSNDLTPKPKLDVRKKGKTPELIPSRSSTLKGFLSSTIQYSIYAIFIHLAGFSHTAAASQLKQVPVIGTNRLLPQVNPQLVCASGCVTTNKYLFNFVGGEVHPIYSELSFTLHENLSQNEQDDVSVSFQMIWAVEHKTYFIGGQTTSNILYGECLCRILIAQT
jgi:hypothetical protein